MDSNPSALLTMITIDLHQHSPHHRELDRVLVDLVPLGRPKRMSSSSHWTATFYSRVNLRSFPVVGPSKAPKRIVAYHV